MTHQPHHNQSPLMYAAIIAACQRTRRAIQLKGKASTAMRGMSPTAGQREIRRERLR